METLTLLLGGVITLLSLFFTSKYMYWKKRNVPTPRPLPILGNYKDFLLFKLPIGKTNEKIYQQFPNEPFVGAYFGTEPVLIPRDPEMIKTIMTKEFYNFSGRVLVEHEHREPLFATNLFFASGDNWRAMRLSFNPMFSTAKIKGMFDHIAESGKKLERYLDQRYKDSEIQNMKDIANNFTLDVIGVCLFGIHFDTLTEEENVFRTFALKFITGEKKKSFKSNLRDMWPNLYYLFVKELPGFDDGVGEFFFDLARNSFGSRNNKQIGRNDLVDFLLKFKEQGYMESEGFRNEAGEVKKVKIEATEAMLASQVFLFFAAGFETSASTMSFLLYELAKHPEAQQRLIAEIDEVMNKYNNEITYEAAKEMKYMEMCTHEILRMYPLLSILTRECMNDFVFPEYGLKVEKGMRIHIPVWGIHHDPKYYPNPERFEPERFSPEEVQKRPAYTFLGFGEGQRICIGLRFAKLQTAVGLTSVLRKFTVERCSKTLEKLVLNPLSGVTAAQSGLEVKLVPRK